MNYYYDKETGSELYQHSENTIKRKGLTIVTFIEETALLRPYGAFIRGFGTKYGKSPEEAIEAVIEFAENSAN